MTLKEYIKQNKKSIEEMKSVFGVSQMTIWRWENGKVIPRKEELQKIATWSCGVVMPSDFYNMGV